MNILEEWSGRKYDTMYDIKKESKDKSVFNKKILNHGQLYFIDIYSDRIVYDHYYPDVSDMY